MNQARIFAAAFVFTLVLTGCAAPQVSIPGATGNGLCHPSQDLPAHKTIKKVPEQNTLLEDLYALFASERKDHATDVRDYNSLYSQCVDGVKPPAP